MRLLTFEARVVDSSISARVASLSNCCGKTPLASSLSTRWPWLQVIQSSIFHSACSHKEILSNPPLSSVAKSLFSCHASSDRQIYFNTFTASGTKLCHSHNIESQILLLKYFCSSVKGSYRHYIYLLWTFQESRLITNWNFWKKYECLPGCSWKAHTEPKVIPQPTTKQNM